MKRQLTFPLMLFLLSILAALAFPPAVANAQATTDCAPNILARKLFEKATAANETRDVDCNMETVTTQTPEATDETPDVTDQTPDVTPDATALTLVFKDDFPLPHDYSDYLYMSIIVERTAWASSAYDVATLVEFYRRELPPLGWQESDAIIGANQATLLFENQYGPLTIELSQTANGGTDIMMTTPVALGVARIPEIVRELPVPANAVNARLSESALSYTIVSDSDTVVEFYRRELAAWSEGGFALNQDGSLMMTSTLFYQLDGLHLLLTLTRDTPSSAAGEIRVFIEVTGQQPEFPTQEPSHE